MFHRHRFEIIAAREVDTAGFIGAIQGPQVKTAVLRMCRCTALRSEWVEGPFEEVIAELAKRPDVPAPFLTAFEEVTAEPVATPADSD